MAVEFECPKCRFNNPEDARLCRKCGFQLNSSENIILTEKMTAITPISELRDDTIFARKYQVIEELGTGGMGKVYKVLDKEINEIVALKLIKSEVSTHKKTIERFKNELKLTRKITHKNICRMYDLNKEENTYYITMEYVPGEDLKAFIRRAAPLSVRRAILIIRQVYEGLAEAHKLGVVHRDLKSNNIMIDKEGNVRIMDFGIARSMEAKSITGSGVMMGTPEYMSPEQAEAKKVDERSDIYASGVLLYEMLTGQLPFAGDTPLSIAIKHVGEKPRAPKELNPQIPDDLNRLILRCLEKEKEDRYQNAEEVLAELKSIEAGIPTTDRVIPKRKPITAKEITVSLSLKKHLFPSLAVLAIILVFISIWSPWSGEITAPIPSDKVSLGILYFKNNSGDTRLDTWRNALAESLITDLHQSKYIRVLSADRLFGIMRKFDLLERQSYASEELTQIASAGQVNHLLLGSFSKAGELYRIETTLQDINSGEVIDTERVQGTGEKSFFSMIDELTRRIKSSLDLSAKLIASDIDRDIGQITTSSPEALKYYTEGNRLLARGDVPGTIAMLEKAIEADPDFAMALRQLGALYRTRGVYDKSIEYRQKAIALIDHVSDRERYYILGSFYWDPSGKTWDKAIETYKKLLDLYPDDRVGNSNLPMKYFLTGMNDKAIEASDKAMHYHPNDAVIWSYSARIYFKEGLFEKVEKFLRYYEKNVSDNNGMIKMYLARSLHFQNKYDLALAEIDKSIVTLEPVYPEVLLVKGDFHLFKGDFINAEREYKKYLEKVHKTYGINQLAALYLLQGKIESFKAQVERGLELQNESARNSNVVRYNPLYIYKYIRENNRKKALELCNQNLRHAIEREALLFEMDALYYKGFILIGMKSVSEAESTAAELKRRLTEIPINERFLNRYYHLMVLIELERKNIPSAEEYFNKAFPRQHFETGMETNRYALYIQPLALAYYQSGDLDKAQSLYEKIIELKYGRFYYGDIYARSFYMLGKIYEEIGWAGKAIEYYEKFLDLWKDADADLPEPHDARARLAKLNRGS